MPAARRSPASLPYTALAEIIAWLRGLNIAYHHAHTLAAGPNFAGDHELLQRLYFGDAGEPILEIDGVMERLQGMDPGQPLEPRLVLAEAREMIPSNFATVTTDARWQLLLKMEQHLQALLIRGIEAFENDVVDYGISNLMQTIIDKHQTNIYLIQQRLG